MMLRNGIYSVTYDDDCDPQSEALIAVRDGAIFGSDPNGAVFSGESFATVAGEVVAEVALTVPPCGELVTGFVAGPKGATVPISGVIDGRQTAQRVVIEVGGSPVAVTIAYLGPLPD